MMGAGWNSFLPVLVGSVGLLFRLAGRTGAGLCALAVFAPVGNLLGAGLGVNLFNALVLGILGAPGFGLLLMLKWVLR